VGEDIDDEGSARFDLQKDDVLELTGPGDGLSGSKIIRHREVGGSNTTFEWGHNCLYDSGTNKVSGDHRASWNSAKNRYDDTFTLTFPVIHKGSITPKGPGTGGNGTWTAEEGG
jgi:hypothetical protein